MSKRRSSGILLPVFSLPSRFGIGALGPEARCFADFLAKAGQSLWQILPLNPTDPINGHSPYSSASAFAGNPLLISPEGLLAEGLLTGGDLKDVPPFADGFVDYGQAAAFKETLLEKAWHRFKDPSHRKGDGGWEVFLGENAFWLDDFALFTALKARFAGAPWTLWPRALRDRQPEALETAGKSLFEVVEREKFRQYLFFDQWRRLREYCHDRGVLILGDMPIYVGHDSADVWSHRRLFKLDKKGRPEAVAGVPPDYFSKTGQLWGNPVYQWGAMQRTGYGWMIGRIAHLMEVYDFVRIDHFKGFIAYWEVPAAEKTAVNGRWVPAPGWDFFNRLAARFPCLPLICEDLGAITAEVREVIRHFGFPGTRVLQFAFGGDLAESPHAPHNIGEDCLVYTGTHDSNTLKGWYATEATPGAKRNLARYVGKRISPRGLHWDIIRLAMMSPASVAIVPVQDILGLGGEARLNHPGTREGNWRWRLLPGQLTPHLARTLLKMTEIYGRAGSKSP